MNRIRSFGARLISRVDWMVSQVENHEALADSAIRDLRRHAARARVQMGRVRSDGRRLREALEETRGDAHAWRERARRVGASDETRALECLERSHAAERRARALDERLREHERIEEQLGADLRKVDERLASLREQRNLMRTRESRAEALCAVGDCSEGIDLEDVFERWDTRITEREIEGGSADEGDSFEAEFTSAERDEELREELRELLSETPVRHEDDASDPRPGAV